MLLVWGKGHKRFFRGESPGKKGRPTVSERQQGKRIRDSKHIIEARNGAEKAESKRQQQQREESERQGKELLGGKLVLEENER